MRYLLLSAMFVLAAACGVKAPIEGRADPYSPRQVYFASPDLANKTAVGAIQTHRTNGILYVEIPIRSASDYDLHIDYQFTFFTPEGSVDYQSPWETGPVLVRNSQQYLKFHSTSGNAQNFQVNLRYAE